MRPLDGLFVLDFSTLLPGPMATLLLAEAGAEVVKVERPDAGEEMRSYTPRWGKDSINFALLNRGKKSIALDLKNNQDRERLQPLIERADVIVEQFRPGVMARLGLDYHSLAKCNPKVIYCSITGYGQSGPKSTTAGHDLNYIGDTGLLSLSMGRPDSPVVPPALIADIGGGTYPAVINILLALQHRQRTGQGSYLDIAMTDNLFPFMYWALGKGLSAGQWPGSGTDLVTGGTPRYRLYPTRDGRIVAAAPIEQKFWESFCGAIGLENEYKDDSKNPVQTAARVAQIISSEDAEIWASRFALANCCCSIVATVREALADPHFQIRGLFDHILINDTGQKVPALPVPVVAPYRDAPRAEFRAPLLGSNNKDYIP
jgi:alpha-methylacyl-CoA racemase